MPVRKYLKKQNKTKQKQKQKNKTKQNKTDGMVKKQIKYSNIVSGLCNKPQMLPLSPLGTCFVRFIIQKQLNKLSSHHVHQ